MKTITLTAYPVVQNNTRFYLTAINAVDLTNEDAWRVDRWNATTKEGYQREINQAHAHRLARYLGRAYEGQPDAPPKLGGHATMSATPINTTNVLPGSIVINFRKPLLVDPIAGGGGALKLTLVDFPGYIIDGQHRIEGVREDIGNGVEFGDYEFPVTLTEFSLEEEMIHFRNLNTTANRPPKGLNDAISHSLYTKYGHIPATWSEIAANRATGITMRIASELASPWYGKVALGGVRKRAQHTTVQAQFSQSLKTLFVSGRFSDTSENIDHIYGMIRDYWLAVSTVWPEAMSSIESSLIQRPTGMFPLHRLLERIFNNVKTSPSREDFEILLQSIRHNIGLTDAGWYRGTGTIDQMSRGYSTSRSYVIIADYLWAAIDDKTKEA